MLSCIRLSESIVMTSVPVGTIYYTTGSPTSRNREKLLMDNTMVPYTAFKVSVEDQSEVRTIYPETSIPVTKEDGVVLSSKLRSVVPKRPMDNDKSLTYEYYNRGGHLEIIPLISKRSVPLFVIRGKSITKIPTKHNDGYKNKAVKDGSNVEADTTAGLQKNNK